MADVGVFSRYKGFADFQEEARKTGLAEALTMAQIQKATAPEPFNLTKVGQEALVKQQMGIPLSEIEKASIPVYNATTEGMYTDFYGNVVRKPGVTERLGAGGAPTDGSLPTTAQPAPPKTPGVKPGFEKYMTGPATATAPAPANSPDFLTEVVSSNNAGENARVNEFIKSNPLPLTPAQRRQQKQQEELAAAGPNPRLQQTIKEKYVTAESPTVKFEQENKLRDEFTAMTKPFRELQDAYSKVQNISDTAAGDIALLYATAKLNDPTSVVRESEFAVQASAGSLGDRWKNAVGKIQSGQRLTESQRQQLKDETENLYRAQLQGYDQLKQQFNGIAYENQLNPKNIIADYATPKKMPATPAEARDQFNASKKPKVRLKYNPATGDFE